MLLIDTHCHLDFPEFDQDRDEAIRRAKEKGVYRAINIGSSIEGSRKSVELSRKYDYFYATVGIHPHEADKINNDDLNTIKELAKEDRVVAIGEIGLDYFKNFSKTQNQLPLFLNQLKLAKELNLPLVIHTREAEADTLRILKEAMPVRAVIHCFSGDQDFLNECLNLGFFVSFTCNITYKKAVGLREMVKLTPLDRLMMETDAPYLSPEGSRGKRNEPMQISLLAGFISCLKEVSLEEVAIKTT
ncbi:MAG: TatD family hydrolase, partial [Candidatus Omnitrophota bacterium]